MTSLQRGLDGSSLLFGTNIHVTECQTTILLDPDMIPATA